jgi:hypothetical protein
VAKFNIVTNLTNGAGLQRDYLMLRAKLEALGHTVNGTQFNDTYPTYRQHDVNIFLEVVNPAHIPYARKQWLVPNSEWWFPEWDRYVPGAALVLCKTPDAFSIWQQRAGSRAVYTGWESNDFYRPEIARKPMFLHMSRNSENKGTEFIAQAWRTHNLPYPLSIVGRKEEVMRQCAGIANVTLLKELTEDLFIQYMNTATFHVAPTRYEGFGMWIHEAIGCGGVVLTTNAPPMNQFNGVARDLLVPVARTQPRLAARFNFVDPNGLAAAVHKAAALPPERIAEISKAARAAFLADNAFFNDMITSLARGA